MDNLFTEENISKLFGQEAAEDEDFDRLQSYYIKNKTHEKLTANLPLRILVGHKGIGKSAIFTIARHEDIDAHRISILIRPDDIANIGKGGVDFSQMIRDWKKGLTAIITEKIFDNLGLISKNENYKEVVSTGGKIINFLKNTFSGKCKDINLDYIDKTITNQFLKESRIIVYIDDLDRGWESKREDIQRISALLNAARDMCNDNKGLQFRISLRTDVYYLVRTSDESTDKIESSVIWHGWTNHEILLLLIKRIATFFNRQIDIEKLKDVKQANLAHYLDDIFERRFIAYGKWENVPMYRILMSLIRKRPRDLVKLCTLAAKDAFNNNSDKIKTKNLQAIFSEYSQGRIQDTVNEYKSELPQIERLLLNMKPSRKEIKEHKGYIYDTNRIKAKIRNIIEQGKFTFTNGKVATDAELLQFMYKINFVTARKELSDGRIERKYFEENKYLSYQFVNFGYDWEIHPAFRWALSPDNVESVFADIDLSFED